MDQYLAAKVAKMNKDELRDALIIAYESMQTYRDAYREGFHGSPPRPGYQYLAPSIERKTR